MFFFGCFYRLEQVDASKERLYFPQIEVRRAIVDLDHCIDVVFPRLDEGFYVFDRLHDSEVLLRDDV